MDRIDIKSIELPLTPGYLSWKLGWTEEFSEGAIQEYKRFLVLALTARNEVTPSKSIDEVWHYHILHTLAYAQFSKKVGRFLHHHPGGPSNEESAKFGLQYESTKALYRVTFGEEPPLEYWPEARKEEAEGLLGVLNKLLRAGNSMPM